MNIKQELEKLGITPRKSRGQNFLHDLGFVSRACDFSGVSPSDTVIEIGPGLGVLTQELVKRSERVVAIELEKEFAEGLRVRASLRDSDVVLNQDVRKVNLTDFVTGTKKVRVVSNIPYSISTDIVLWLVENFGLIESATLLMQKEFAVRLAASPGEREGSSLSVMRERYAVARLGPTVSGNAFHPPTKVESQLLRLDFRPHPLFPEMPAILFEKVVRAAFSHRRKTLLNSLFDSGLWGDKERIRGALDEAGIDPQRRAETLTVAEFAKLLPRLT